MAEAFSDDGVPVFLVDVKGDLSGLVKAGEFQGKVAERIKQFHLGDESYLQGYPVSFGTCSAKRESRYEPPFPKWDRYCFPVCSI